MEKNTDYTVINTQDDENLSNYFESKTEGDSCSLTIKGNFLGLEGGNAKITINEVEIDASMPTKNDDSEGVEPVEQVLGSE